jgi:hypothetical protein
VLLIDRDKYAIIVPIPNNPVTALKGSHAGTDGSAEEVRPLSGAQTKRWAAPHSLPTMTVLEAKSGLASDVSTEPGVTHQM